MAYGVIHFFPGGTSEQYEASIAVVHPSRTTLPPGQIYHAAGPSEGGWTVVAIFETKAAWEKFRDQELMPALKSGVEDGFAGPPEERTLDIYNLQQ